MTAENEDRRTDRTPTLDLFPVLRDRLDAGDDPGLWDAILKTVLREIEARWEAEAPTLRRVHVGLFKVMKWLRPHQARWTADGDSFAAPRSYTLPPDQSAIWGVWFSRGKGDTSWRCTDTSEPGRRKRGEFSLRLSIPGNSSRHAQAALAGEWRPVTPWLGPTETEAGYAWYGFRRTPEGWRLTGHTESKPPR